MKDPSAAKTASGTLTTDRLRLIPFSAEQLVTIIENPDRAEAALGFTPADGLRSFFVSGDPSSAWLESLRQRSGTDPWELGFAVVHAGERMVIGSAGFKGSPSLEGVAEIAYAIVPAYEGRGYATEAARALIDYAFENGVKSVIAHTLPEMNASGGVLYGCGFVRAGELTDPQHGLVWRWERRNAAGGSAAS